MAALKSAMQGSDVAAIRRASEDLQQAVSRIGERMYGEPAGAGVGADGAKQAQQETEGSVEGEFREV